MTVFPTDPAGLPEATGPALLELADGDIFDLRVGPVAKRLGDTTVRMLGYNGSIPGPTLKVPQGAEIRVEVTNHGDLDTTVHWHGLRLENRYDGVPHETQEPIPVGGGFTYRIQFPDPGLYWYHPHIREDYTQELGLYGNILVVPAEPDYWPPADREFVLTLDDVLVEDGAIAPFSTTEISHVAMGRYGTVLLTAGQTDLQLTADAGDVVRLWLTNTANTRVFNVRLPGARMKLVGGDSGRVEREEMVEEVLLAPSERAAVDVLVDRVGALALEHHTPTRAYRLATLTASERRPPPPITEPAPPSAASDAGLAGLTPGPAAASGPGLVAAPDAGLAGGPAAASGPGLVAASDAGLAGGPAAASGPGLAAAPDAELGMASADELGVGERAAAPAAERFPVLRGAPELRAERQQLARWIAAPPDKTLALVAEMDDLAAAGEGPVVYTCPMHPDVTSAEPGRCPQCGMKLLVAGADIAHTHGEDHDHMAGHEGHGHADSHDHMAGHAGHGHAGGLGHAGEDQAQGNDHITGHAHMTGAGHEPGHATDHQQGHAHEGDAQGRAGPSHAGPSHEGDSHEGDSHEGDSHEGDSHEGDSHEGDSHEGHSHEGHSHEGHSHDGREQGQEQGHEQGHGLDRTAGHDSGHAHMVGHGHAGAHHSHDPAGGIEWEDEMVDVNRLTTTANMRWRIVDRGTGAANAAIDWRFTVGERVKIRLVNEMDSDHPMHHPFHIHGAGRFLVLARDGQAEPNLVWKDTVLIRTGQVVDILLDVTNPGLWMAHCHIAEHMQGGMMFSFTVAREQAGR